MLVSVYQDVFLFLRSSSKLFTDGNSHDGHVELFAFEHAVCK
jgi:hypothetical protein